MVEPVDPHAQVREIAAILAEAVDFLRARLADGIKISIVLRDPQDIAATMFFGADDTASVIAGLRYVETSGETLMLSGRSGKIEPVPPSEERH